MDIDGVLHPSIFIIEVGSQEAHTASAVILRFIVWFLVFGLFYKTRHWDSCTFHPCVVEECSAAGKVLFHVLPCVAVAFTGVYLAVV